MKTLETNKSGIGIPQIYEAPAIEIFEIEVEKGFAGTGDTSSDSPAEAPGDAGAGGGAWPGGAWY